RAAKSSSNNQTGPPMSGAYCMQVSSPWRDGVYGCNRKELKHQRNEDADVVMKSVSAGNKAIKAKKRFLLRRSAYLKPHCRPRLVSPFLAAMQIGRASCREDVTDCVGCC